MLIKKNTKVYKWMGLALLLLSMVGCSKKESFAR